MTPECTRLELPADAVPHLTLAWTRHTHDPSGRQLPPPPSPTEEEMEAWLASDPWEHPWETASDASSVGSAYDEVEARPGFDTAGFLDPLGSGGQCARTRQVPDKQMPDAVLPQGDETAAGEEPTGGDGPSDGKGTTEGDDSDAAEARMSKGEDKTQG